MPLRKPRRHQGSSEGCRPAGWAGGIIGGKSGWDGADRSVIALLSWSRPGRNHQHRTHPAANASPQTLSDKLSATLAPLKVGDQRARPRIGRGEREQGLGMDERRCDVALVTGDGGEREQHLAVGRVGAACLLQHGDRLRRRAGGVQRNGIDIGVAGVVRRQLARLAQ